MKLRIAVMSLGLLGFSVAVVAVMVHAVMVPISVGIFEMTPVPIGIANPTTPTAIN